MHRILSQGWCYLVYFVVGLLGVALFSAGSVLNPQLAVAASHQTASIPTVATQSHQNPSADISLWRNPSHQELNFYQ